MSKTSQRAAAERAKRVAAQQARLKKIAGKTIAVPVGGTGVVLDRRSCPPDYQPPAALAGPMFEHFRRQWLDGEDRFLLVVARVDGRYIEWEFGDEETLLTYLDVTLHEFAERRSACVLQAISDEPLKTQLEEVCGSHVLEISEAADPARDESKGLDIQSFSHPGVGRVVWVTVSKNLIDSKTVAGLLRFMDSLVAGTDAIEKNWLCMRISFDGFNSDPREVFEIPEVRAYIQAVAEAAPWWIGLVSESEHMVWLAALSRIQTVTRGASGGYQVQFEPGALEATIQQASLGVGPLLRCAAFEDDSTPHLLLQNLSMALGKLLTGTNPVFDDPLAREIYRHGQQGAS